MLHLNYITLKQLPFLRLFIALTSGIIVQWYLDINVFIICTIAVCCLVLIILFFALSSFVKFTLGWLRGIFFLGLFFSLGSMLTWQQTVNNNSYWYGNNYGAGSSLLVTIKEPLVEKPNSYKAEVVVTALYKDHQWLPATGNVFIYFKKEAVKPALGYGSQIIIGKTILPIQNSGNPDAFNYNRYCLFQGITGQVFVSAKDYIVLDSKHPNAVKSFLFVVRGWALNVLQQNIHSPKELGIAEALLIGYRNDLDKDLVQAYSNTGVVHIIAISGLHIGVIYGALTVFFSLFKSSRIKKYIQPVFILFVIWMFTLIAGAAPSILRAAVMFTCILAGKFLNKNGNIYNTLFASAFILLVVNPFYLWDVGFQLSYAAVFSIVVFYKPVNELLYFKNRTLRWVWQLTAISLSAQIFTLPVVIYHFHQLPLMFLFTNLVAVPLSGVVLFGELLLFCFSWWQLSAAVFGTLTETCIRWMNGFIQHSNQFFYSVWDGLHISIIQLLFSFFLIAFISVWLFGKNTKNIFAVMVCAIAFFVLRDVNVLAHRTQKKLIVYNVSKQTAIDVIAGNECRYAGDSIVLQNVGLKNFNLKPSRIKNRVYTKNDVMLPNIENHILDISSKKILLLGDLKFAVNLPKKIKLDVLILSDNCMQSSREINHIFSCNYIVADGSVPAWKSAKWKKEFQQLHLRFYPVTETGAFTLKL